MTTRRLIERRADLKSKYGMLPEQYTALYNAQGGVCAICLGGEDTRRLQVDHDHKNGKIRGLLCFHCNTALGKFKDDCLVLQRAKEYLEANNG